MILGARTGGGVKNISRMNEGVMVVVFLLEMLKRCSSCRIIGARLRDSLDMFKWCVLIKVM